MSTRTDSSSTILLALVLIITFPLWIGLGAGLFGICIGLAGAAVGIVAAMFGVMVTLITLPFRILFGWGDHSWHFFPSFHGHGLMIIVIIIIAALIIKKNRG